jgi:hypothetical protein
VCRIRQTGRSGRATGRWPARCRRTSPSTRSSSCLPRWHWSAPSSPSSSRSPAVTAT